MRVHRLQAPCLAALLAFGSVAASAQTQAPAAASGKVLSPEVEASVLVRNLCGEAWVARDVASLAAVEGQLASAVGAELGQQAPVVARLRAAFDEIRTSESRLKDLQMRRTRFDTAVETARGAAATVHQEILELLRIQAIVHSLNAEIAVAADANLAPGVLKRKKEELISARAQAQAYQQENGTLDQLQEQRARFLAELDTATGDPSISLLESRIQFVQTRLAELREAVARDKRLLRTRMARLAAMSAVQSAVRICVEESRRGLTVAVTATPTPVTVAPPPPPAPAPGGGDDAFQHGEVFGRYRGTCTGSRFTGLGTQTGSFQIFIDQGRSASGFFHEQSSPPKLFVKGSYGPATRQAGGKVYTSGDKQVGTWKGTMARSGHPTVRSANGTLSLRDPDGSSCEFHFWAPMSASEPTP